ncbi:MAG: DUF2851 family protein, partial [Chitinophagaceae bacterium]
LHYAWRFRKFQQLDLRTSDGVPIQILETGQYNTNAGPDFLAAKIRIGNTLWAGCVEMHLRTADWDMHGHQHDEGYANVILHVVFEGDGRMARAGQRILPELQLAGLLDPALFLKFHDLTGSGGKFPCAPHVSAIDSFIINAQLSKCGLERLEHRTIEIQTLLKLYAGDWNQTTYHWILKSFGFRINSLPMEMLARALPYTTLSKHITSQQQIESLLFGTAGFLNAKMKDEYGRKLKSEFQFLKRKFELKSIPLASWKFMRMRPANFPTFKIAQFAAFFRANAAFLANILETQDLGAYRFLFKQGEMSAYWKEHYHFQQEGMLHTTHLGASSIDLLILNSIIPLLMAYGNHTGQLN